MRYYAHISENGEKQTIRTHCQNTSDLCRKFAAEFNLGAQGKFIGYYHDIGKCSAEFQNRLLAEGAKVDHSSAGAIEAKRLCDELWGLLFAYAIAGHHSGLQNYGSRESGLLGRLYKEKELPDYHHFSKELPIQAFEDDRIMLTKICAEGGDQLGFRLSFLVRMLYSALVDADFLDTEAFMDPLRHELRKNSENQEELYLRFYAYIQNLKNNTPDSALNRQRDQIFAHCAKQGKGKPGFYTLTVPTGGGKTLSSMAFALEQKKKRIIYVIPYTSIIQQTANIFREIFGDENVLEHHSNYDFFKKGQNDLEAATAMKLSSENWDSPITVTTNVQFFESLFANKPSRCRKLHHIANSVIILDEAQMIPLFYLKPCLLALEELVKRYGATVMFCTATKPELPKGILSLQPKEIIPYPEKLHQNLRRTELHYLGVKTDEEILALMQKESCCLCIVNTKNHAQKLYEGLDAEKKFHLSAAMCHRHREKILNQVKECLKKKEPCILISTPLIECGVDISFPVVFRAMAGLDSIIQSAGRCDREGELASIGKKGQVYIFEPEHNKLWGFQQITAEIGRIIIKEAEDKNSFDTISQYFSMLYRTKESQLDKENILNCFNQQPGSLVFDFETAAKQFKIIQNTDKLIIAYDETTTLLLQEFRYTKSKSILRKLQPYIINIYPNQLKQLKEKGGAEQIGEDLWFLRTTEGFYKESVGLSLKEELENLVF